MKQNYHFSTWVKGLIIFISFDFSFFCFSFFYFFTPFFMVFKGVGVIFIPF